MQTQVLALEVTKPSEQTFKCLAPTRSRGGVILLFTQPIGTQEFENMEFLRRHALVPSSQVNDQLWSAAGPAAGNGSVLRARLLKESPRWRGVRIPGDPAAAANFIWWMHASGILARMHAGTLNRRVHDEGSRILGPDGVAQFWDLAASA
jgi:hypothetical protein